MTLPADVNDPHPGSVPAGAPRAGFALLLVLAMAQFMVVLDFTIVNVARRRPGRSRCPAWPAGSSRPSGHGVRWLSPSPSHCWPWPEPPSRC